MKLLARMMTLLSFLVMVQYANAANSIYMDQVGDGTNISITQTGAGNAIGTSTSRSTFTGDNNTVTIQQIGNNNVTNMTVNGDGATISSITTGSSNIMNLECGANGGACGPSTITKTVTGDGNQVTQSTDSLTNTTLSITSDNNTVNMNSTASSVAGTTNVIDIAGGGGNVVDVTQAGTGTASTSVGHQVELTIYGALNVVDFRQGGTVDSKIVSTITGSSNAVTIKSNHP
jgi:hypothetical protein